MRSDFSVMYNLQGITLKAILYYANGSCIKCDAVFLEDTYSVHYSLYVAVSVHCRDTSDLFMHIQTLVFQVYFLFSE